MVAVHITCLTHLQLRYCLAGKKYSFYSFFSHFWSLSWENEILMFSFVIFTGLKTDKMKPWGTTLRKWSFIVLYQTHTQWTLLQGLLLVIPTTVGNTAEAPFKENPWSQARGRGPVWRVWIAACTGSLALFLLIMISDVCYNSCF